MFPGKQEAEMLVMARTSDDYRPCVALWPDGRERRANVHYLKLMQVGEAVEMLRSGKVAWIAPGDVPEVRQQAIMGAG